MTNFGFPESLAKSGRSNAMMMLWTDFFVLKTTELDSKSGDKMPTPSTIRFSFGGAMIDFRDCFSIRLQSFTNRSLIPLSRPRCFCELCTLAVPMLPKLL